MFLSSLAVSFDVTAFPGSTRESDLRTVSLSGYSLGAGASGGVHTSRAWVELGGGMGGMNCGGAICATANAYLEGGAKWDAEALVFAAGLRTGAGIVPWKQVSAGPNSDPDGGYVDLDLLAGPVGWLQFRPAHWLVTRVTLATAFGVPVYDLSERPSRYAGVRTDIVVSLGLVPIW